MKEASSGGIGSGRDGSGAGCDSAISGLAGSGSAAAISGSGLTTAACLWVAAGIGMAIGVGLYLPGIAVTLLSLLSLLFLKRTERFFKKDRYRTVIINAADGSLSRDELVKILDEHGLRMVDFAMDRDCENGEVRFDLVVVQPENVPGVELANAIAALDQVKRVRFR